MIIFLRHAQAENNAKRILAGRTEGVHLTKTGIEQAEQIAKYLKPLDISAIYSSPIERASHLSFDNHLSRFDELLALLQESAEDEDFNVRKIAATSLGRILRR